jgi:predicted nucleic acid-binding protein
MRPIVLDASARVATLARPHLLPRLVGAFDACAPTLFRWEVGNAIHGRSAKDFGDLARRKRLVATMLAPVRLVDQAGREDAIADVVARTGLTFYDASYVQLALDETAPLVTEDHQMLDAGEKILGPNRAWTLNALEEGGEA